MKGLEEINIFTDDGNVIHITNPKGAYWTFHVSTDIIANSSRDTLFILKKNIDIWLSMRFNDKL